MTCSHFCAAKGGCRGESKNRWEIQVLLESEETEGLTVVADAPDRSLHTRVFEELVREFLETCTPKSRRQFVFTAYDVNLLSEDTFRRDELWAVEKRPNGESSLSAFADFKEVRRRRDLRKLYLEGAFGGVPPCASVREPADS